MPEKSFEILLYKTLILTDDSMVPVLHIEVLHVPFKGAVHGDILHSIFYLFVAIEFLKINT